MVPSLFIWGVNCNMWIGPLAGKKLRNQNKIQRLKRGCHVWNSNFQVRRSQCPGQTLVKLRVVSLIHHLQSVSCEKTTWDNIEWCGFTVLGVSQNFYACGYQETWSLLKVKTTTTCCRSRSNYIRFQHCFPVTIMPGNSLLNIKLGIYPKAVIKVQWGFTVRYQWKRKGSQHKFPALEPWGQSSLSQGDLIQLKERVCHVDSSHVREKEESRYIAARW